MAYVQLSSGKVKKNDSKSNSPTLIFLKITFFFVLLAQLENRDNAYDSDREDNKDHTK